VGVDDGIIALSLSLLEYAKYPIAANPAIIIKIIAAFKKLPPEGVEDAVCCFGVGLALGG
jgi:hypothetical protein